MSEDKQVMVPPSTVSAPGVNVLFAILLPLAGPEEFDLEVELIQLDTFMKPDPTKRRRIKKIYRSRCNSCHRQNSESLIVFFA